MTGNGFSVRNGPGDFRILHGRIKVLLVAATPVHLYVVKAPPGELQKILLVVAFAPLTRIARANIREQRAASITTGIGVNARLQSQRVDVANDVRHVAIALALGKSGPHAGLDNDIALLIALAQPPAFIDVH